MSLQTASGPSGIATGAELLELDALLPDEQRDVRDMVRDFADDRVLPHVVDWYEEGAFPREIAPEHPLVLGEALTRERAYS